MSYACPNLNGRYAIAKAFLYLWPMQNMQYNILGEIFRPIAQLPFARTFAKGELVAIDLSVDNAYLPRNEAMDLDKLTAYVSTHIKAADAKGAWGGYGEKRDLYRRSRVFAESDAFRNIHLGIDFWLPAGTAIAAPLPAEVHSFADNNESGNYGPTVVLMHQVGNFTFHSLYGHLSRQSLESLEVGQLIRRGQVFAKLGKPAENRDWPPHLHFQLISDMEGMEGDYPGVCFESEKDKYLANCPNPVEFLHWTI
jgi:murein DD-endopeptidase MepM/ murein hydrolase activator NlpD